MSTTSYIQAANLSPEEKLVLEAIRTEVLGVAGTDEGTTAALTVKVEYIDAVAGATYHMEVNPQGISVADLTDESGAAVWARANLLKTAMLAHMAGVGTKAEVGEHLVADTALAATLAAVPVASSTATTCTLAIAIGVALIAHGNSAGVHFHDDTSSTGSGYTPTSDLLVGDNKNTEADAIVELNALDAAMLTHFESGTVS